MSTRRLPVFIAIDTSGSMRGEPIESVNVGMQAMLQAMRQDPYALESVYLSVLTYDIEVTELFPLTALENVQLPTITCPDSGPTHLGEALKMVVERFDRDVVQSNEQGKGDWRPMFFVMTDGAPSDVQLFNDDDRQSEAAVVCKDHCLRGGSKSEDGVPHEVRRSSREFRYD